MPRSHSLAPGGAPTSRAHAQAHDLERLLTRNLARVLTRVRAMLGDGARRTAESCDHVQDAFVEVLREGERVELDDDEQLVRRMAAIARNNIRDAARRRRERGFDSVSGVWSNASRGVSPLSQASHREQVQALVRAVHSLTEEERRVVELRAVERLRFAEIARRVGRHEDTVRKAYHRALLVLGRRLSL